MTETIAERYQRLSGLLADTLVDVDPHRWNDPSPCEGWSVLDVLRHLIETQGLVAGFMDRELGPTRSRPSCATPASPTRSSTGSANRSPGSRWWTGS